MAEPAQQPAPPPVEDVKDANLDLGEAMAEESAASTESSTEENLETTTPAEEPKPKEAEAAKDPEETDGKPAEGDKPKDAEQTDETKQGDENPAKKGAEARKEQLQTEIRQLVSKRNEIRQQVAEENAKAYRVETQEELVADGMDPAEAKAEAAEQSRQMSEFNTRVADLNSSLDIESIQIMADFPVFDPDSDQFDETLAKRAQSVYEKAAQIKVDPKTKLVVNANVLPYEIYQAFAETHSSGATKGEVSGQKATEKMLATAEPASSSGTAPTDEDDPFLQGFNKVK